jgi:hypothetical protein
VAGVGVGAGVVEELLDDLGGGVGAGDPDGHLVLVRPVQDLDVQGGIVGGGVETAIRARLAAGEWAPGGRLPPVAEFAIQYAAARGTVVAALRRIESDGLIEIVANWGTFRKQAG